jgi:hypothetical protein
MTLKTNMVAREVQLTASGMHAGKGADERDLFTEDAASVLVGENGGVIRLSAAVTSGQLLLLTNVESKSEVVVQVKRRRIDPATGYYLELEFAESAPQFWGMTFSAATALLPKDAHQVEVAEMVGSAEVAADDPSEPSSPTAEELQAFRRPVEILRKQAKLMERLAGSEPATAPAQPIVPEAALVRVTGDVRSTESNSSDGLDKAPGVARTEGPRPVEPNPLPAQLTEEEEALLPKPSLDFTMPQRKAQRARGNFTPNFRRDAVRLTLLTVVLVVTAVGALWERHWIPWKSGARKESVGKIAKSGNGSVAPQPGNQETEKVHVASNAPVTSPGVQSLSVEKSSAPAPEPAGVAKSPLQTLASSGAVTQPAVKRPGSASTVAVKRLTERSTAKATSSFVRAASSEAALVPPKLIKSVRAVASLDDLRDFETGNVVIDAVVGTSGEVHFISVLSGPPSLRPAAVQALKQYLYEPAMRQDQPVPAHVTITVRFHFEP